MHTFPPPQVLRFEDFSLDLTRCALRRADEEVPLRPKSFDVLRHLAERAGRPVAKDELMKAVWPDVTVTDGSLVQCIKDIREALGDDDHRIVKTVSRRGYMFAADVLGSEVKPSEGAAPASLDIVAAASAPAHAGISRTRRYALAALAIVVLAAGGWALWSRSADQRPATLTMMAVPSIAVAPFRTSAAGGVDDGAHAEEIATELARVPRGYRIQIKSASGTNGMADPTAIGRRLGVRYLIWGSIRREGEETHLNVQLIEAATGRQLWGQPFSYSADPIRRRAILSIARLATERLTIAESQRPLPASPKAEHYAIKGRALIQRKMSIKNGREALALFEQGLKIDPMSIPALQGYARVTISMALNGWLSDDERSRLLAQAEAAILRVFDQEPTNYGTFRLLGSLHRARGDPMEAVNAFKRALDLNSSYASAHAELGRAKIEIGQSREAIADIEAALAINPSTPDDYIWYFWAGQAALHIADYQAALDWLERSRQASPRYPNTRPWIAVAYAGLGQHEKARAVMKSYLGNAKQRFSIAAWNRLHPRHNDIVAAQRARIEQWFRDLGVPDVVAQAGAPAETEAE